MGIPTKEPREVILGDTIKWQREDLTNEYPAPTWTLTYYFTSRNPAKTFSVVASAAGAYFLVDLGAVSGVQSSFERIGQSGYEWIARVSNGSLKYTVGSGFMSIAPNPANFTGSEDRRSWAVRTLEALKAVIEGRADADVNSYLLAGKQVVKMTPEELKTWFDWISELAAAELADAAPAQTKSRVLKVRLGRSG